ncbi:MAG: hypothetical protein JWO26_3756 [Rhodospirillales bacterium]|nr:hypothetical protein [Rhodospirillales bacterium]
MRGASAGGRRNRRRAGCIAPSVRKAKHETSDLLHQPKFTAPSCFSHGVTTINVPSGSGRWRVSAAAVVVPSRMSTSAGVVRFTALTLGERSRLPLESCPTL